MKIIDYVLLEAPQPGSLTTQVTKYLADNWRPLGSPQMANTGSSFVYIQAMVKEQEQ